MKHVLFYDPRYPESPRDALFRMADHGIDGVFMNADPGLIVAREIVKAARECHLSCDMLHLPFRPDANAIYWDTPDGDAFYASLVEALSFAISEGIPTVVIHYGSHIPPQENDVFRRRFTALLARATDAGIAFCLENLRSTERLVALFNEYKNQYPALSLCFDAGHALAFTRTPEDFPFATFKDRIRGTHLHDNDGLSDLHQVPFSGVVDFKYIMARLKENGYCAPLTFECLRKNSPRGMELDGYYESIEEAFAHMEELWEKA